MLTQRYSTYALFISPIIFSLILAGCSEDPTPKLEPSDSQPAEVQPTAVGEEETEAPHEPTDEPAEPETEPVEVELIEVPSPDWQDQIIYFLMTDRFADGDPTNNDQGVAEYVPAETAEITVEGWWDQ